jgi:hypothetical protein
MAYNSPDHEQRWLWHEKQDIKVEKADLDRRQNQLNNTYIEQVNDLN